MTLQTQMTVGEAQAITTRIKGAADHLWQLLFEAHERKAHNALGYGRWEDYVKTEFQMSRSYSYRLINHANVMKALKEADPVSPMGDITERQTRGIDLDVVVDIVKQGRTSEEAVKDTLDDADGAALFPHTIGKGISRQARAIYDLKAGQIIVLPHNNDACARAGIGSSCGLVGFMYRYRKTADFEYVTSHTRDGGFIVGCYDPSKMEDLNY